MEQETASTATKVSATSEVAGTERREAFGTAKTENLRDSGLWRIILPVVAILCCLMLLALPLIILGPLFAHSVDPHSASYHVNLLWVWIVMAIIEIVVAVVAIRGLVRVFMTQAGNYRP